MAEHLQTCQFCETSKDVRFKCDDCTLLLCKHCNNKLHSKIPLMVEHKVTEIQTDFKIANEHNTLNLKQVNCSKHIEQSCFAFCQKCDKCICSSCLVKSDDQENLNKIFSEKLQKLKVLQNEIDEDLPFFTENADKLWKLKEEHLEKYNEIKQQILNKEEEMKDEIAEQAICLVKELDEWWSPQNDEISEEQTLMSEAEKDLKERKNIIEEALQSEKMESVMTAADLVLKDLPTKAVRDISTPTLVKFSTKNSTKDLVVGSLLKIPKLEIVQSFACDVTVKLCSIEEDVLLGFNESDGQKKMKKIVLTKNRCYYTQCINDIRIWDATVTSSGEILFTYMKNNNNIKKITKNNEIQSYHCTGSLIPLGIHANDNGTITVGYKDNVGPLYPPSEESKRGIIIINENRTIIKKFDGFDYGCERLFHLPHIITINSNNDICVIDFIDGMWEGRVITLDRHGKLKWIYKGHPKMAPNQILKPRGITTSSCGQIFISDRETNSVHMLTIDGDFITSIGRPEGIYNPIGLASNKDDQIFVGCPGKLHILKASVSQPSKASANNQEDITTSLLMKITDTSTSVAETAETESS